MSSKKIFWFGILCSILLIIVCLFTHVDKILLNILKPAPVIEKTVKPIIPEPTTEIIEEKLPAAEVEVKTPKKRPYKKTQEKLDEILQAIKTDELKKNSLKKKNLFTYGIKQENVNISGTLSKSPQTDELLSTLETICQRKSCSEKLQIGNDANNTTTSTIASEYVKFFYACKLRDINLTIKENLITVEGTLYGDKQKSELDSINEYFINEKGFVLENKTVVNIEEGVKNIAQEIDAILKNNVIEFQRNSDEIRKKSKIVLDEITKSVMNISNISIEISGYTDASGDFNYNLMLSQKRADSVMDYLITQGIQKEHISAVGYGETKPIAENPYDRKNRRVEIDLIGRN